MLGIISKSGAAAGRAAGRLTTAGLTTRRATALVATSTAGIADAFVVALVACGAGDIIVVVVRISGTTATTAGIVGVAWRIAALAWGVAATGISAFALC